MKRFLKIAAVFMFMTALFIGPACAGYDHYTISVSKDVRYRSGSSGYIPVTSGIQYLVLDKDLYLTLEPVEATIYNDRGLTQKLNPTHADTFDAEGKINFYVDDTDGAVDIIVVDNDGGYTLFMNDVTPSCHTAIIDERPGVKHHGMIWFSMSTDTIWSGISTEALDAAHTATMPYMTGVVMPAMTMINDVSVEVINACTDSTDSGIISVGLSSITVGLVNLQAGDGGGYFPSVWTAACNVGELLWQNVSKESGSTGDGVHAPANYILVEAQSLNYTLSSGDGTQSSHGVANAWSAGWGFIHYFFTPLRAQ